MAGEDDLMKFSADLGKVSGKAVDDIDAVLKKGAQNIKNDLVSGVRSSRHFFPLARAISYDAEYGVGSVSYEIGPDKGRRGGALGNIYYFGTSRGGGHGDLDGPLARETPNLDRELSKAVDRMGDLLE